LLVEAGYPNGFEINVISDNANKDEWELLQTYLSQIDITVNVELMDWAQWINQAKAMEYDAQLCHQGAIYHWDRVFGYFVKDSSANWLVGGYHNDAVAELLAVARKESDLSKAKETYAQILQIIQDDAAAVFIGAEPILRTWRSWVKGYDPAPNVPSTVWPGGGLNYVTLDEKP
jgi:ABC-type transport system substrate-binding protein